MHMMPKSTKVASTPMIPKNLVTNRCRAPICHKVIVLKSDGLPLVQFGIICIQNVGAFGIICSKGLSLSLLHWLHPCSYLTKSQLTLVNCEQMKSPHSQILFHTTVCILFYSNRAIRSCSSGLETYNTPGVSLSTVILSQILLCGSTHPTRPKWNGSQATTNGSINMYNEVKMNKNNASSLLGPQVLWNNGS